MGIKHNRFIERSIMSALSFLKESIFADEYASRKGFLQARDPRIKILMILALLLAVLFAKSIPFISCIYALCLFLAFASSINIAYFLKRTWFFMPLFSLFIAVPALFSVFSPGETLISIKVFTLVLSITKQGLASAAIFFLRILTSVSLCVLLALTTKHYCLLRALRNFRVPQLFVMTLGMCYRYVYLFIALIQDTYTAIKSRVGYVSSSQKGRRIVAWNIASLWRRSYDLHNQVYQAMLSRGYSGEPRIMDDFYITFRDIACMGVSISILAGSLWQARFLN